MLCLKHKEGSMDKDLVAQQRGEIEATRGKHPIFPRSKAGWVITGITTIGTIMICAVSHFDGGTVLGGLFVVGTASGFSDDVVHALLYGKRFPERLATSKPVHEQVQAFASGFAERWLGLERNNSLSHESLRSWAARWLGMPVYDELRDGAPVVEATIVEDVPAKPKEASKSELSSDRLVTLAPDLHLDIDDIAGKAVFICGIRRSGKTTLGVRIAEELGKFNIPMLIPDLKGDWLSCVKTLPNVVILGKGEATEKNARAHGYAICEEQIQIILDITTYDDMNEVAMIIANMIDGIFLWERKHPQDRRLCAVFQDEMQSFLPQNVNDSIIPDAAARDAMMNAHMRVIAVGGSLGLFPVTLTQRIAQTNNKVIGQPELMFLFKQKMDSDFNRYKNFTNVSVDQIKALGQGQGIFVSYEGDSSIHTFHKRTSSDAMSATPRYNPNPSKAKPEQQTLVLDDEEGYLDIDVDD